ncbi:MAG: three-Cys-motif partner protein TcmP [Kordiimonadaceae bacterium]|nr:three-Cys-motif partner protein TcmP [Kordiimonadaceae bacterium]PCJ36916.1 MAG: hypothetical protein COA75_06625 [Cellvibrionales bacterium]
MPKKDTANKVKPHTEAKLQFYTRYLERYLEILLRAGPVEKINIYDMFCGEGVYSDGKTGSAVRAVDAIWKAESSNERCKPINLHLNDLDGRKIDKLRACLDSRMSEDKKFRISYSSYEAFSLLAELSNLFEKQDRKVRNLVFIDPYGYKAIQRDVLEGILINGKTEVIIFLPIEQMYRFRNKTIDEVVEKSYQPLKEFVGQFDLDVSSISSEKEFIQAFTQALAFSKTLFTTSYAIKNHTGHYYGMFFITPNLLGLEKIIEVKWGLDSQQGEEFSGHNQNDFFLESEKKNSLEKQLEQFLQGSSKTNIELYGFVLSLGFLPKHANEIFRRWQNGSVLDVYDLVKNKAARKGAFKLNYKDSQSGKPLFKFSLN